MRCSLVRLLDSGELLKAFCSEQCETGRGNLGLCSPLADKQTWVRGALFASLRLATSYRRISVRSGRMFARGSEFPASAPSLLRSESRFPSLSCLSFSQLLTFSDTPATAGDNEHVVHRITDNGNRIKDDASTPTAFVKRLLFKPLSNNTRHCLFSFLRHSLFLSNLCFSCSNT